uniref:WD40 repeat domain-containing protein n=1 Tax=Desertifilum tharense IPPAS B-1220 TaxID=1781255 RepID=A0ACD5GYI1_9CYAN
MVSLSPLRVPDYTVKLWDLGGTLQATLSDHRDWVTSVSFSADGQTLASASADNTIKLWSRQGRLLHTLKGHNSGITSISFTQKGQCWFLRIQMGR